MPILYGDHQGYAQELIGEIDQVLELISNENSGESSDDSPYMSRIRLHLIGFKKEIQRRVSLHESGVLAPEKICDDIYF